MEDFELIYREYGTAVYYYLLSLSRDPHLAEELTQETMVRAMLNISRFRGECKLTSWLCQIARNLYLDHRRKQQRAAALEDAQEAPYAADDVAAAVEQSDTAQAILAQVHRLEEPYKEVFLLHALGDVPLKQISSLFGKSDSWARVVYYRAKAMIKGKLEEG